MSMVAVRRAIRDVIMTSLPELNVYSTVPGVTQVPAVVIAPSATPSIEYDKSFGKGAAYYYFDVMVMVPFTEMDSNQNDLDKLLDPDELKSVVRALKDNRTLNGTADAVKINRVENYGGSHSAAQVEHIGAVLKVQVYTC